MPKYFLDCGANDGCSIRLFRSSEPDAADYLIHSFEPNPDFAKDLRDLPGVVFHPEAVWNQDCEATFYLSRAATRDGSTLLASKTTGKLDRDHPITVRCIDFGAWVKRSFTKDDFLIVKLDIEGAEYAVLRKMIDDGSIELVDRLYVEFHADRIGLRKDVHNKLVAELTRRGLQIQAWDALGH